MSTRGSHQVLSAPSCEVSTSKEDLSLRVLFADLQSARQPVTSRRQGASPDKFGRERQWEHNVRELEEQRRQFEHDVRELEEQGPQFERYTRKLKEELICQIATSEETEYALRATPWSPLMLRPFTTGVIQLELLRSTASTLNLNRCLEIGLKNGRNG